jgi:hypothetical protein
VWRWLWLASSSPARTRSSKISRAAAARAGPTAASSRSSPTTNQVARTPWRANSSTSRGSARVSTTSRSSSGGSPSAWMR